MKHESIIEKIKALLRLGRSSNRHEAELALTRAFDIAEKYRIDLTSIDPDSDELIHETFSVPSKLSFIRKRALGVVVNFFHVDVCFRKRRALIGFEAVLVFVGTETEIAIANYAYEFIVRAGTRALAAFVKSEKESKRRVTDGKRKTFIQGFIYGIIEQLRGARQEMNLGGGNSIVLANQKARRERYMNDLIPETTTLDVAKPQTRSQAAMLSGYEQGKKTQIRTPVTDGQQTLALE